MAELLEPDAALAMVLAAITPLPPLRQTTLTCLGLVTAAEVRATTDQPSFPRAMMDGVAVRCADAGQVVTVQRQRLAGDTTVSPPLTAGSAYAIMTGAAVPPGADAVVPVEQLSLPPFSQLGSDGATTQLPERIKPGANIVGQGEELQSGAVVLAAKQSVTPMAIAAGTALGIDELLVHPIPRIAVLTTGNELTTGPLERGQIHDSNGPMLAALLAECGWPVTRDSVHDDPLALAERLATLADHQVVILTGGVSTGSHDHVPVVLQRLGAQVVLHKVSQKPGKPLLVARTRHQWLFALPGNPLAVHACACRYVIPALRGLMGGDTNPRTGRGELTAPLPSNRDRTWFIPALVDDRRERFLVTPLVPVSSADLFRPLSANAYLRLEPGSPAQAVGTLISFTWIGTPAWR